MSTKTIKWMPIVLTAFCVAAATLLAGCSSSDCMVADVVTPIHEAEASAKGYKLAVITTGMQDKVVGVSLFKKDTEFDECGKPKSPAYDEVVVENNKKVAKILTKDNKIYLEYSSESGSTDFQSVPVEFI